MKQQRNWKWTLLLAAGFVMVLASGCTKEGLGGDASLTGIVAHHGLAIPGAVVYIKFGTNELPGTNETDFDISVTADEDGLYLVEELQKGDYYLYAVGYDSSIAELVRGGVAATLSSGEARTLDVAVTE